MESSLQLLFDLPDVDERLSRCVWDGDSIAASTIFGSTTSSSNQPAARRRVSNNNNNRSPCFVSPRPTRETDHHQRPPIRNRADGTTTTTRNTHGDVLMMVDIVPHDDDTTKQNQNDPRQVLSLSTTQPLDDNTTSATTTMSVSSMGLFDDDFRSSPWDIPSPWEAVLEYGLSLLSISQQEDIARMHSIQYETARRSTEQYVCCWETHRLHRLRQRFCDTVLRRYYESCGGNMTMAVQQLVSTLQFRTQHCVSRLRWLSIDKKSKKKNDSDETLLLDTIQWWVGSTLTLRNKRDAATLDIPTIFVDTSRVPCTCRGSTEAWLYCLERAQVIAEALAHPLEMCSGGMFAIAVDCRSLKSPNAWSVPLLCLLHDAMYLIPNHYPGRLQKLYILQAPWWLQWLVMLVLYLFCDTQWRTSTVQFL